MRTLEDIVPKLVSKTQDGSINWEAGSGPGTYQTTIGKYSFQVWEWEDEDGITGISIGIRNLGKDSEMLDTLIFDKFSSKHHKMREFFGMARRNALNLDRIISEIDDELDKILPF